MENIELVADEINEIFEIIDVVYNPTNLSFDNIDTIISHFTKALNISMNINFTQIRDDLHNELIDNDDIQELIRMTMYSFVTLINWKESTNDIILIKESQKKDLIKYFDKLRNLGVSYSQQKKDIITDLFVKLGLRLLKARLDLEKIIDELKQIDEIQQTINSYNKGKIAEYNLKLAPDKTQEFARILLYLYSNNYFLPLDIKTPISEADLFMAFENFLDTDVLALEPQESDDQFQPENMLTPPTELPQTNSASPLSPGQLKIELNAYLTEAAYQNFLEALRNEFKAEKGKTIAILLYVLQNANPPILTIPHGKMKKFYNLLKAFFNTNIGTYQSIANFAVNKTLHKEEIKAIQLRVENMDLPF